MRRHLVIMFILLLSAASAEEQIFKGWVDSGKKFAIDGINYTATYTPRANITVIKFPDSFSMVIGSNESCHTDYIYRACLLKKKFLLNSKEVPWDTYDNSIQIQLELQLYASYANIDITKAQAKTDLVIGESQTVTLLLNNTGGLDSTVRLRETYPSNFRLDHIQGCDVSTNIVSLQVDMVPNAIRECKYRLTALSAGEKLESSLIVNYSIMDRSRKTEKKYTYNIDEAALILSLTRSNITTEPSREEDMQINITAYSSLDVTMFRITFPEQLVVTKGDYRANTRTIEWRGQMAKDQTYSTNFSLKSDLIINTSIQYELYYTYDSMKKEVKDSVLFSSRQDFFYVGLVNTSNGTKLRIANPTKNIFKNIRIMLLNTGATVQTIEIAELGAKRYSEHDIHDSIDSYVVDFKTVFGQPMSISDRLTFIQRTDIFANLTKSELPAAEEVQIQEEEELVFEPDSPLGLDTKTFAIIGGAFLLTITIIFSVLFRHKHHDLDKEIKDIRKQMSEESKEEETSPPQDKE